MLSMYTKNPTWCGTRLLYSNLNYMGLWTIFINPSYPLTPKFMSKGKIISDTALLHRNYISRALSHNHVKISDQE